MEGKPHHIIKRVTVVGGFLDGLDVSFADGLGCVIGPRGAGKTSLLELIRYGLDEMPGRKGDPLRERVESIIATNLAGGRVELGIQTKDGQRLTITRAAGEAPLVFDQDGHSVPGIKVRGGVLFQADVLSQNQIESIAEMPHYQLDLIDKFRSEDLSALFWKIDETRNDLKANAASLVPLIARRDTLEAETGELPVLQTKLAGLKEAEGTTGDAINQAHAQKALRDRENRVIDEAERMLEEQTHDVEETIGSLATCVTSLFTEDLLDGPNGDVLNRMLTLLRESAEECDRHLGAALHVLQDTSTAVKAQRNLLGDAHRQQELAFRRLVELHRESIAKSGERTALEKRCNDLMFKKREIADVTKRIDSLTSTRTQLLNKYSRLHDDRFGLRSAITADLTAKLSPTIRVRLEQAGDSTAYRTHLENLLRKSSLRTNIVAARIASTTAPDQLVKLLRNGDTGALVEQCRISERQAGAVMLTLNHPDILFELETMKFEDVPYIELFERGAYKESSALSTGQRCTAILPILLFESVNPLLIDQPEDNLDNRYIYETVVEILRKVKLDRQLIFVTHNPNIPVLGDAELVMVMESDGRHGRIARQGSVDDCKTEIVTLLEGGADAFAERGRRYHL